MFGHAKSRALACCVAILVLGLSVLSASASATPTTSPAGTWLTASGHGVVAIGISNAMSVASDLYLWSMSEFRFIDLAEGRVWICARYAAFIVHKQ